jgi:hypothetical protein
LDLILFIHLSAVVLCTILFAINLLYVCLLSVDITAAEVGNSLLPKERSRMKLVRGRHWSTDFDCLINMWLSD